MNKINLAVVASILDGDMDETDLVAEAEQYHKLCLKRKGTKKPRPHVCWKDVRGNQYQNKGVVNG